MEEGDDGGAVTHCGATRALARKHTHYQRRRPRLAGVTHERHGRDLDHWPDYCQIRKIMRS